MKVTSRMDLKFNQALSNFDLNSFREDASTTSLFPKQILFLFSFIQFLFLYGLFIVVICTLFLHQMYCIGIPQRVSFVLIINP